MGPLVILTLSSLIAALQVGSVLGATWDYPTQNSWGANFPLCNGNSQSPIEIREDLATTNSYPSFNFINYNDAGVPYSVRNNGHTVVATPTFATGNEAQITGGGLSEPYVLGQYHLHWGRKFFVGSEHVFSIGTPRHWYWRSWTGMELHLVHYKQSLGSVGGAVGSSDGLAVLGIMFKATWQWNSALEPLLQRLASVSAAGQEISTSSLASLINLLPYNRDKFYRYQGSLTTPTCNEAVIWTVFEEIVPISYWQFWRLRNAMRDSYGGRLWDNFRFPQPLNGRTVYKSW